MTRDANAVKAKDRSLLQFAQKAREAFLFLAEAGFTEIEVLPTVVRYRKGDVEVDIYHGRKSYEVGGGVTISGTRYAMSEIVRASNPDFAAKYRNAVVTTAEGVAASLGELSELMQRYGASVLSGKPEFPSLLRAQRQQWAEDYALDVLAGQLRPKAEDAFRRGDYSKAVELYGHIRARLSPAETKKLALAEERSRG